MVHEKREHHGLGCWGQDLDCTHFSAAGAWTTTSVDGIAGGHCSWAGGDSHVSGDTVWPGGGRREQPQA